jgi:hypothetical protein
MKITTLTLILVTGCFRLLAQNVDQLINPTTVGQVERSLSSDAMRGRATFTPDIERAADYIESEFKKAGLKTLNGGKSYRQPFVMVKVKNSRATITADGAEIVPSSNVIVVSTSVVVKMDEHSPYEKVSIKGGDERQMLVEALHYIHEKKDYLVLVDPSYTASFARLRNFVRQQFKSDRTVVFVLASSLPEHYSLSAEQELTESKLANVVGILPGRSKEKEYVIFSGHYDHLGIGKPDSKGDSIYNGANDDASGTTAVILLANYFGKIRNNERTLVFAAFTAEEIGEYGSQYFSLQFEPAAVAAMFNIEMIGTESKWGANSAFITGYERTDMAKILEKNLKGSPFTFYPDPYPDQQLFYRSDNASLAKLGVPAHTISTFPIDTDHHYHTPDDDIDHLDMKNMARIISSIAISAKTIVSGQDTPSRVNTSDLR